MSHLLNQYSNCNWTASGELECPDHDGDRRVFQTPHKSIHHVEEIYTPISDTYSGLSRELDVSVYAPRAIPPTNEEVFPRRKKSGFCSSINNPLPQIPSSKMIEMGEPTQEAKPMWSSSPNPKKIHKNYNMYYFQTPLQKYNDMINEFGQPTLINTMSGGMAIWQKPSSSNKIYNIFKRIDIVDEQCFSKYPYPHIGFLYTHVKLKIPLRNLNKVLSISGDVMYDITKNILIIRGMSLNYNIALIALICLYVSGQISWYNICGNQLIHKMTHHKRLTNLKYQQRNMKILHSYLK